MRTGSQGGHDPSRSQKVGKNWEKTAFVTGHVPASISQCVKCFSLLFLDLQRFDNHRSLVTSAYFSCVFLS